MRSTLKDRKPASPTAAAAQQGRVSVVLPAEASKHVGHDRLHSQGDPVHAGSRVAAQEARRDVLRIALDGHLGIVVSVDAVERRASSSAGSWEGVPPPKNTVAARPSPAS